MSDLYKRQQEKVEISQNGFQDLILKAINEAFNAGRKAESKRFMTDKATIDKGKLFNLQAKYGVVLLEAANRLSNESNKLRVEKNLEDTIEFMKQKIADLDYFDDE